MNQNDLDDKTRFKAILTTLLGCQGSDENYHKYVPIAKQSIEKIFALCIYNEWKENRN